MAKWYTATQLSNMSYSQITRLIDSGELSLERLRSAYTDIRKKAMSRARTVSSERVKTEFGNQPKEYFQKQKSLTTSSQLVAAVVDAGKFIRSKGSTITGLKSQRQNIINQAEKLGFDIDEDNYKQFAAFMKWFHASEYSNKYDSDAEEVIEVFNSTASNPSEWKQALEAFTGANNGSAPIREYPNL